MSRRRSRRRQEDHLDERDSIQVANAPLHRPTIDLVQRRLLDNAILSLDDRRHFHPDYSSRPVKSPRKDQRRVVEHPRNANRALLGRNYPTRFAFKVPEKVTVCVRRKQRKEVLFALKKMGRGGGRRRRRNEWSDVSC